MAAATVHGTYNYWLGGAQHVHADRELGQAVEAEFPAVPPNIRAAKEFHLRAARWCAQRGIARFVRAGAVTWQPGRRNVHDAARAVNPGAEVVYVNRDGEAHAWARELLADGRGVAAVRARASRPAEVLDAAPVARLLAQGEPVCLIIGMVLHFTPAPDAAALLRAYGAALPSGSVVAVSLALPGTSPRAERFLEMFTPAQVRRHTAADVTGWLEGAGLELVPPGAGDVRRLLPGRVRAMGEPPARAPVIMAGALGLVP